MNSEHIEKEKKLTISSFFSYYRKKRPEKFSDTVENYEIPLTKELFEMQMERLSTKKMQGAFENFIVSVVKRQITPNIKPQTGPDGGGDGKVDAETYQVSDDIADKWYSCEDTAKGEKRWAFAISCMKKWKSKVESDVAKIAGTNRGYSRVLFFSNQFIKASTRLDVEKDLSEKYGIKVDIFDGLWCENAVFNDGCMGLALEHLEFSDEYKKRQVIIGPNDKARQERLDVIEKNILRHISGIDTEYIDELHETCLLSRGLERPRTEIEGRFMRAMRECEAHGTPQQMFLLIYDHAWTCFFWFEDIDAAYADLQKLKPYIETNTTVLRLERYTTLLTNLINLASVGLYDVETVKTECDYIKKFEDRLKADSSKPSCLLFLRIYLAERRLISHIQQHQPIDEDIAVLRPLLLDSTSHIDISFETNYKVINMLSEVIEESQEFDDLIDEMADILAKKMSQVNAADLRFIRAEAQLKKKNWKSVVKQLGFCVYAYEQEEYQEKLIKSAGYMGIALRHLNLPYSSEAYLLKCASFLIRQFYATGIVPHLLVTVLQKLCELEVILGRIVMFWNWYELLHVVANNGQFCDEDVFKEATQINDAAWACRLSVTDLRDSTIAKLPDIFERLGMYVSSEYLKLIMGYSEEVDKKCLPTLQSMVENSKLQNQPLFEQLLDKINISASGQVYLKTSVRNHTICVSYENDCEIQRLVEIFLASVESFYATFEHYDVMAIDNEINVRVVLSTEPSVIVPLSKSSEYEFRVNKTDNDDKYLECILVFISNMLFRNSVTKDDINAMLASRQNGERLIDRVTVLQHTKFDMVSVLGKTFKYKLEDWMRDTDKLYTYKGQRTDFCEKIYTNHLQSDMTTVKVNSDMSLWDYAGWSGCCFVHGQCGYTPPCFGLVFKNLEIGKTIVSEWKPTTDDGRPRIHIYIVRGIDAYNPTHYRVCIAPAFPTEIEPHRYIAQVCRKHTMTPATSENLDRFEEQFQRYGVCGLMAFQISDDNAVALPESFNDAFIFSDIEFREAHLIGLDDEARIAIEPDDNPYIPQEAKDTAPVVKVLKELQKVVNRG